MDHNFGVVSNDATLTKANLYQVSKNGTKLWQSNRLYIKIDVRLEIER